MHAILFLMRSLLLGLLAVLVLVGAAAGVYFWFSRATPVTQSDTTPEITTTTKTWEDEAGFRFDYPEGVEIDKNEEDDENYAHVELTHPDHPGTVIVWVSDPPLLRNKPVVTVTEWVESQAKFAGANTLDSTLGGEPAKKIIVTTPPSLYIGAVYDGLVFYIEGMYDQSDFWSEAQQTIADSFVFVPLDGSGHADSVSAADPYTEVVDEEEVIQ